MGAAVEFGQGGAAAGAHVDGHGADIHVEVAVE